MPCPAAPRRHRHPKAARAGHGDRTGTGTGTEIEIKMPDTIAVIETGITTVIVETGAGLLQWA